MYRPIVSGPVFVAALFVAIVCAYWPTFYQLIDISGPSAERYTHRTVVIPVFFALLWSQRFELATLPVRSAWWALPALIGAGAGWLAGELVFARVLTDLAVIAMVPIAVLTVLGTRWVTALVFPLAFLLFVVPVWGPLVPSLVDWTAKATFAGIQASGVPIYREGAYFMIPSGAWSIADACSGVKYLITCLMLGVLYAWSMFQSTRKRIAFVGGALLIGIVGNWIRAYLTIMIAHLSDNRFLRDDHGTFGWILFALFMFGYGWLWWRFREDSNEAMPSGQNRANIDRSAIDSIASQGTSRYQIAAATTAVLASLAVWPLLEMVLLQNPQYSGSVIADIAPQRGWSRADMRSVDWTPDLTNPTRERTQSFVKNGNQVEVFTGIFQNQTWNSKLVTSVNQFVDSDKPNWSLVERGIAHTAISGKSLDPKTGIVLGRGDRILAWQWYWLDGLFTGNDIQAKVRQFMARIQGRGDSSAWVAIYTKANVSPEAGAKVLAEFMQDMGGSLEPSLIMSTLR